MTQSNGPGLLEYVQINKQQSNSIRIQVITVKYLTKHYYYYYTATISFKMVLMREQLGSLIGLHTLHICK